MFPKLVQVSEAQYTPQVTVEGKGYVTVDIARNPRATNLYWQLVDPVFSLLEVGFEWPSGRLISFAVPLFKGEMEDQQTQPLPQATVGTPFFDLSPWSVDAGNPAARGNHLKQSGRIRLLKKQNGLSIICKDGPALRSVAYGGNLVCDFGGGDELMALGLVGNFPV